MSTTMKRNNAKINEFYTLREEIVNGITHGVGALLSMVGMVLLIYLALRYGDRWHVASFMVFGGSLILLYLSSTLYHTVQIPRLRPWLRVLDHSAVFLLIAGTYTPFLLVALRDLGGWALFAVVWGIALLGIVFKVFFIGKMEVLSTIAYIGMGWMSLVSFKQLLAVVPAYGVAWLIAGGVIYTIGVLFYALEKMPYNHAVWHLFVLGGSICHFVAVSSLIA